MENIFGEGGDETLVYSVFVDWFEVEQKNIEWPLFIKNLPYTTHKTYIWVHQLTYSHIRWKWINLTYNFWNKLCWSDNMKRQSFNVSFLKYKRLHASILWDLLSIYVYIRCTVTYDVQETEWQR